MSQLESFCEKNNLKSDSKIVFVPFAGVFINGNPYPQSYDAYTARVKKVFAEKLGLDNFVSVHEVEDKIALVNEAACIVVGGGNTFHLVAELHRYGLMEAISKVAKNGTPYIGWSAGSNIACPTLCTTNDMPIVQPASFKTLNLIPFQINPHYLDPHPEIDKMIKHGGETRQDRINEYLAVNQNMKVVGVRRVFRQEWRQDFPPGISMLLPNSLKYMNTMPTHGVRSILPMWAGSPLMQSPLKRLFRKPRRQVWDFCGILSGKSGRSPRRN